MNPDHEHLVLYENINQLLTLSGAVERDGRHCDEASLGIIENAALVVDSLSKKILWVGGTPDLPPDYRDIPACFSGEGEVWLPELVECHTHLVHAGFRQHEFAMRAQGKTYQDIAAAGGGILTTVKATREASASELVESGQSEVERFQRYGVGTIEIKSGYGLTLEDEIKMLECIEEISDTASAILVPTFLPAHAVPPEYRGRVEEFVDVICQEWLPEVAERKLAVFFDAFIEQGYFSAAQARKMAETALELGFKLKLHVDQFSNSGGTELGLELGAVSLDHLEQISADNIRKFGASKTVAVLCPGASIFAGTPYPPARALADAGARVALSTDFNPGTCPSRNLPLMTTIACTQMKLTVPEAIVGITYNAAAALGMEQEIGSLQPGKLFKALQIKAPSYEVLPYCFGELES